MCRPDVPGRGFVQQESIITPPAAARPAWAHGVWFAVGLGFLTLAKAKHLLQGYSTPKPFGLDQVDRCIDYAVGLADLYAAGLARRGVGLAGRDVLELGPGSDLGVGLQLVQRGAARYLGLDRHDIASRAPAAFYGRMAARGLADLQALRDGRVALNVDERFDVAALGQRFDIVVSNAAFEHFDDVERTVAALGAVVRPGGVALIAVDLQTHSRWIRERDPNNIYRYPPWLYRCFAFPGQPNRVRPQAYRASFERAGWQALELVPNARLAPERAARPAAPFRGDPQADWLSFSLFARRPAGPA
jgi:SAM-dependent methyltransferase